MSASNAERKQDITKGQAVVDEANAFVHDCLNKEINPTDVVIAYREAGGGFGIYVPGGTDPLMASGLLAHAQAALTKQTPES